MRKVRYKAMNEQVTVVVPAYNEESRISAVLKPLIRARKKGIVTDIIVVDDGSTDGTVKDVSSFDVKLVKLGQNLGKGAALVAGIQIAKTEIILFLDADLVGLKETHIQRLLAPIVDNKKIGMTIGIFKGSGWIADIGNGLQVLSGQRALRKSWAQNVPRLTTSRYGADSLITRYARKHDVRVMKIYLRHLSHKYKEQKKFFLIGFFVDRMKMYRDIAKVLLASESEEAEARSQNVFSYTDETHKD